MVLVSAFKDGYAALRANPILLVAGLLVGGGSQLQNVEHLIDSPLVSAGASLAWLIVFPFVLGGFIETARAAIEGTDTSVTQFLTAARTHYLRLLLGTVVFVLVVLGTAIGLGLVGFILGIGSMALAAIHEMAAFAAGVGSLLVWLLSILVVIMFVQFYDVAIVIEDQSVTDSFRRSVALVRSNLRLCSFGTLRLISRISHAPAEVVDGGFQQHFTELQPPASRTHGCAERALD
jgi:hypothetical protein